jgi:pimeloyl-ACP methyl ester carboxylesterase
MKQQTIAGVAFILMLITCCVSAVELKSQSLFGVMGQAHESGQGIAVQSVLPDSTAQVLGLQAGDIIITVNQQQLNDFQQLIGLVRVLVVGDQLTIKVLRADKEQILQGKMLGKPQEKHDQYQVLYDTVDYKNNTMRSMIYKPLDLKPGEKRPALFYVQGYTCQSIDYAMIPQITMQQLLNQVVLSGYVVYKMEKLGVGDSTGELDCLQVDFSEEMAGFLAGIKALKSLDYVNSEQVLLFGHSLGGVYAPLLAEQTELKGIAVYGSVVKSWYDYLLDIYTDQAVLMGTAKTVALENAKVVKPLLTAWLKSDLTWDEISSDPRLKPAIDANLIPIQGDQVFHRHYTFFRDLNKHDLQAAWQKIKQPVFAMHGAFDIQAINEQWAKDLVNTVNQQSPGLGKLAIFDNTDHGLMKYPSRQALQTAMNGGSYNPAQPGEHYNSDVANELVKWMKSVVN